MDIIQKFVLSAISIACLIFVLWFMLTLVSKLDDIKNAIENLPHRDDFLKDMTEKEQREYWEAKAIGDLDDGDLDE